MSNLGGGGLELVVRGEEYEYLRGERRGGDNNNIGEGIILSYKIIFL